MKKTAHKKRHARSHLTYFFVTVGFILVTAVVSTSIYLHFSPPICANAISCINDLSGKPSTDTEGVFMNNLVKVPSITNNDTSPVKPVLGESLPSKKHIYVDLTNQRLLAYDGSTLVYTFAVSTGKWGRTPTGDFKIWVKLRSTRMSGGSKALGTYYNLPNVPYTMFFYNDEVSKSMGYSLHGAYWHTNFGHPMSHGCVNLSPDDARTLYAWTDPPSIGWTTYVTDTNPATPVTIYGESPLE